MSELIMEVIKDEDGGKYYISSGELVRCGDCFRNSYCTICIDPIRIPHRIDTDYCSAGRRK